MKHKRLLTMVFALFAAIPLAFAFAACDDSSEIDPKPPITDEQGNQGEQGSQGSQGNQDGQGGNQEHTHSGERREYDDKSHWKVCDDCGEAFAKEAHDIKEGACLVCGYSEKYTEGLIFELNEESDTYTVAGINDKTVKEIIIPSYYQEKRVTTIGTNAFSSCEALTSVTIPNSVTTIEGYAFSKCESLTSMTIGNGVMTIGEYAFFYCRSLTNVTIGDGVTTIGRGVFRYCTSLTSVTIGNGVITIGESAFGYCDSLTSIEIPDNVTTVGEMAFYGCDSLTSIEIPDSVTTIGGGAFYWCTSLTSVTIGNGVTTIGSGAFDGCTALSEITYRGTIQQWNDIEKDLHWTFSSSIKTIQCQDGDITL